MSKIIEADNLSFNYGNEPVFAKIGFEIDKKDFVAIVGANGAGKSTLLRLILGEITPAGGTIRLFGQDIRRFRDWPRIGYVPQTGQYAGANNFPATAEEIVRANLFAQIGLLRFPGRAHREKARRALEMVGMGEYAQRMIGELSGGQQQRVMLARVLAGEPEVMILDEPTAGVDTQTVQVLYTLLSRLNRELGITIVMVTHDIGRAASYVSRTLCLEEGSLVELGQAQIAQELAHKHKHPGREGQTQEKGDDDGGCHSGI